jgi:hypothetical protein
VLESAERQQRTGAIEFHCVAVASSPLLLLVGRRSEWRALELADDLGLRRLDQRSRSALGQLARR